MLGINPDITFKKLTGECAGYKIFNVDEMKKSDTVGTPAIARELGAISTKTMLETLSPIIALIWIPANKTNILSILTGLQMSLAPMLPGDLPRLYIFLAKTVPHRILADHICVPAICRTLDNLILATLTANPPEGMGKELKDATRALTQSDKLVGGLVVLSWVLEKLGVGTTAGSKTNSTPSKLQWKRTWDLG